MIQTAKTRELAPLAKAASANLRLLHPDWEYLIFDDEDIVRFIRREFPQYSETYESFPYRIQRFDFFRYLAVLRYGGFYFDLDVFLSEELSSLLPLGCVFPFEELSLNSYLRRAHRMDWELGNYAFGAAPNHPFIAEIVRNCVRALNDDAWAAELLNGIPGPFRGDFHVLNTTGPGLVTRTYAMMPAAPPTVTILCPGDIYDHRTWHRFGRYGIHLMAASWRGHHGFIRRRISRAWENWRRRRYLSESRTEQWLRAPLAAHAP